MTVFDNQNVGFIRQLYSFEIDMTPNDSDSLSWDSEQVVNEEFESLISLLEDELSKATEETLVGSGVSELPEKQKRRSSPDRRRKSKTITRVAVTLLAVLAITGWAAALTLNTLPPEFLEWWQTQYQNTDFSITDFSTKLQGPNKISFDITLANNDGANTHYANVTLTLLNATGDEIVNQTKATGAVAASGSWTSTYVFSMAGVGSQYSDSLITIRQSS